MILELIYMKNYVTFRTGLGAFYHPCRIAFHLEQRIRRMISVAVRSTAMHSSSRARLLGDSWRGFPLYTLQYMEKYTL